MITTIFVKFIYKIFDNINILTEIILIIVNNILCYISGRLPRVTTIKQM